MPVATSRLYWYYLGCAHLLYALLVVAAPSWLASDEWHLRPSPFAFITVIDVLAAPALLFAWLWRHRPAVAVAGATAIAFTGLLACLLWGGRSGLAQVVSWLPDPGALLVIALCASVFAYEVRVFALVCRLVSASDVDREIESWSTRYSSRAGLVPLLQRAHAIELRFWAFSALGSKRTTAAYPGHTHFAYGKQSSNAQTWLAWAAINAIPTPLVHLLLHQSSPAAAWLTTLATLFGSLWCVAESRASRHRPVSLDHQRIYLRYGLTVDRHIPLAEVSLARRLDWKDLDARGVTRYAGCGGCNVRLELRCGEIIHIGLDNPDAFLRSLGEFTPQASASIPERG